MSIKIEELVKGGALWAGHIEGDGGIEEGGRGLGLFPLNYAKLVDECSTMP